MMKKYKQPRLLIHGESTQSSRVISDLADLTACSSHCALRLVVNTYLQYQIGRDVCDEVMKGFCVLGLHINIGKCCGKCIK